MRSTATALCFGSTLHFRMTRTRQRRPSDPSFSLKKKQTPHTTSDGGGTAAEASKTTEKIHAPKDMEHANNPKNPFILILPNICLMNNRQAVFYFIVRACIKFKKFVKNCRVHLC